MLKAGGIMIAIAVVCAVISLFIKDSPEEEMNNKLDRSYLPEQVSPRRKLVDYNIPTRGEVKSIAFVKGAKYESEAKDGGVLRVTGKLQYCINSVGNERAGTKTKFGCDTRLGTILLR